MITTRMSTKGQVIIPKSVRDQLGVGAGTEYAVEIDQGEIRLVPRGSYKTRVRQTTLDEVVGCLVYDGPPRTMEKMRATARQWVGDRFRRS